MLGFKEIERLILFFSKKNKTSGTNRPLLWFSILNLINKQILYSKMLQNTLHIINNLPSKWTNDPSQESCGNVECIAIDQLGSFSPKLF